jgi:hypothetical protein
LGAVPPLGPTPEYPRSRSRQTAVCCRRRLCLLKGCERPFQPRHPLARYCSAACRQAARRWSQWRANKRYRASDQGQSRRREQSHRWRNRAQERYSPEPAAPPPCEGYHKAQALDEFCCSRPGCYSRFARTTRSPLQNFCSFSCRQALRRVLQRESRWLRRSFLPRAVAPNSVGRPDP